MTETTRAFGCWYCNAPLAADQYFVAGGVSISFCGVGDCKRKRDARIAEIRRRREYRERRDGHKSKRSK